MHELDCCVVVQLPFGAEVKVELVEEAFVDVGKGKIAGLVLFLDEVHDPVLADLVSEEALLAVVLRKHEFLIVGDEKVKEFLDADVLPLVRGEEQRLYLVGGDGLARGLQVKEVAVDGCLQLIEGLVDGLLLLCATESPVT